MEPKNVASTGLAAVVLAIISGWVYLTDARTTAIASMVEGGAAPITARCAVVDDSDALCLAFAGKPVVVPVQIPVPFRAN